MAVNVDGELPPGVTAKDIILAVIAKIGTGGGQGYVIEYRGSAIEALSMEGRMTICNMSIEAGARAGMVAPDETTFEFLRGRPHAPTGADWDAAVEAWEQLRTDEGAEFDTEVYLDAATLSPFVTWGTNPGQGVPLAGCGARPRADVRRGRAPGRREGVGLHGPSPGTPMREIAVDTVFVGSCTNGRIEDLRVVADVLRGRKVADGVRMLVVPGLDAGARAGRIRRPGRDLHRRGRRVASGRMLDVPRHEPRSARAGRALRVDVEPQLRGPAGQGRPHPPGLAGGRRRHRRARHPVLARPICSN